MIALTLIAALALNDAPKEPEEALVPQELSLQKAEALFLSHGLDLLIAEAQASGAEGDLRAAGAHPNPNLGVTGLYGPETSHDLVGGYTGPLSTTWGFGATVSDNAAIEDILSGKHGLRVAASARALAAAKINIDDVKRLELSQLRQAYVAAVLARLNVDAAQESFETYDKQLKLNEVKFKNGAVSGLDLSRILQAQLEALQALDQAKAGELQAHAALLFLLGVRHERPTVTLTTAIDFREVPRLEKESTTSLVDLALSERTDVRMAQATLSQKEAVLAQAKRARIPDIQVQVGYSEQCNSQTCSSAPTFSAGLSGNLPVFYQQQGEIRRAQSDYLAAQEALVKSKAQVLSDVSQGLAGYQAAKKLVERMEGQLLGQAKRSRDLAQLLYSKGAASLLDFMDAQRAYVAATLEYHQDLAGYWTSVYQLEQATGATLR
jgi:cobalt-zinc-cadmium efflux system outer membrane protein